MSSLPLFDFHWAPRDKERRMGKLKAGPNSEISNLYATFP